VFLIFLVFCVVFFGGSVWFIVLVFYVVCFVFFSHYLSYVPRRG
jgi:hypothetical protein